MFKKPTTGPYPEPVKSSLHFVSLRPVLLLPFHLRLGLLSGLYSSDIPIKMFYKFIISFTMCLPYSPPTTIIFVL
jgi:hypothetical protein